MRREPNPVVARYTCVVSVGGPSPKDAQRVHAALNRAHGFEDGNCNIQDENGNFIAKSEDISALTEAAHALDRYHRLVIEVSLYKNGHKAYRLQDPERARCKWSVP